VKASQDFIQALQSAGPVNWVGQRWYELALDFANGKYGLLVDSDHYVAFFENPQLSKLVGKIGYALPPAGPTGQRKPNLWTWSLVMNTRSQQKQAAWEFIEWASGRDFLLRSVFEGNMNPTRTSIWDDPAFVQHTSSWGDFVKSLAA
jgi:multiple sugar transport system substrate-binding protein